MSSLQVLLVPLCHGVMIQGENRANGIHTGYPTSVLLCPSRLSDLAAAALV
jgi:hypothetical protein